MPPATPEVAGSNPVSGAIFQRLRSHTFLHSFPDRHVPTFEPFLFIQRSARRPFRLDSATWLIVAR